MKTTTLVSIIILALSSALSAQTILKQRADYVNYTFNPDSWVSDTVTVQTKEPVLFLNCTFYTGTEAAVLLDANADVQFVNCKFYGTGAAIIMRAPQGHLSIDSASQFFVSGKIIELAKHD